MPNILASGLEDRESGNYKPHLLVTVHTKHGKMRNFPLAFDRILGFASPKISGINRHLQVITNDEKMYTIRKSFREINLMLPNEEYLHCCRSHIVHIPSVSMLHREPSFRIYLGKCADPIALNEREFNQVVRKRMLWEQESFHDKEPGQSAA